MRLDTLVQNGVGHLALRDTKIGGYDLPKVLAFKYEATSNILHFYPYREVL